MSLRLRFLLFFFRGTAERQSRSNYEYFFVISILPYTNQKKKKKRNTPFLMEIFFFKIVTKKITKNCEYCIEEHVRAHMHTHAKFIKKTVAKNSGFLFVFPNSCNCFQKKTHTRIFFFERRTLLCESVLHKESLFHLPHKFVSFFAITHKTKTLFFLACLGTFATREELGNSWKIFTWF